MINYKIAKKKMVDDQIKGRGITNSDVVNAFLEIDRHLFVRDENLNQSYDDNALPIGYEQTISQPYMVAIMTELLSSAKDEIVLEIGTGSGYQAAILSKISKFVVSVERNSELVKIAKSNLQKASIKNISVMYGDGTLGWKDNAPYDGIIVAAGSESIPKALIDQLKPGGRMIIPIGKNGNHKLKLILKEEGDNFTQKEIIGCSFVPLIGRGV